MSANRPYESDYHKDPLPSQIHLERLDQNEVYQASQEIHQLYQIQGHDASD